MELLPQLWPLSGIHMLRLLKPLNNLSFQPACTVEAFRIVIIIMQRKDIVLAKAIRVSRVMSSGGGR